MKKFRIRLWEVLSEWEVDAEDKEEAEKKGWGMLDPRLDACDFMLNVEEIHHKNLERLNTSKVVYVNEPNPFGENTEAIKLNGWQVVNAPRPLPGDREWTGECRHGIFYAAGDFKYFGKAWVDLDAWPVKEITNLEIIEILRKRAEEAGGDFGELVRYYGMERLAHNAGYPWR